VIEFEVVACAALYTSPLIALPDSSTYILRNTPAITCRSFAHKLAFRYTRQRIYDSLRKQRVSNRVKPITALTRKLQI
jgi:serine/threonine protein phosphatase PrpC